MSCGESLVSFCSHFKNWVVTSTMTPPISHGYAFQFHF
jgi:hypothetical protein